MFIYISIESGDNDLTNVGHFIVHLPKNRQLVPILRI